MDKPKTMTRKQKLDLLRSARESFNSRLTSITNDTPYEMRFEESFLERKKQLEQCKRFCDYLEVVLTHNRELESENIRMLDYIGLPEIYECETVEYT